MRRPTATARTPILQASVRLQLKVRDDITTASDMMNQIEWMRKQLEDQAQDRCRTRRRCLKAMEAIDKKMQDVEYKLITRAEP